MISMYSLPHFSFGWIPFPLTHICMLYFSLPTLICLVLALALPYPKLAAVPYLSYSPLLSHSLLCTSKPPSPPHPPACNKIRGGVGWLAGWLLGSRGQEVTPFLLLPPPPHPPHPPTHSLTPRPDMRGQHHQIYS